MDIHHDMPAEAEQNFLFRVLVDAVKVFVDAIAEQSQYAESHQLMWDRFGGLTMYACSLYGLSTLFVALVLNRTAMIASTNHLQRHRSARPGIIGFMVRHEWTKVVTLTLLRLLAMMSLLVNVYYVLVALSVKKQFFKPENLSRLTRMIPLSYIHYDPDVFAHNKYMGMPNDEVRFGPTSAMLWPVFWSVSYSLFVETFASAINGVKPFLEGGITLFELSLALQEMSSGFFFLREHNIAKRPSEQVLMVCLFLLADHIVGQFGALCYRNNYRLIPLTFLNFWFVWYFVSTITLSGLLFLLFPLNILFTYLGLVLVLIIILICLVIFVLAIITKGSSLQDLNYASYFMDSEELSEFFSKHLSLSLRQDFYTAVVNIGIFAITLAGKSSYITEYSIFQGPTETWLETGLWARVQAAFGVESLSELDQLVQSGKLLKFLKENNMTGYGNVINVPSERLTIGSSGNKQTGERISALKVKMTYLREIAIRFGQLVWSLVYQSLIRQFIPRVFKKYILGRPVSIHDDNEAETEQDFEVRKSRAPAFVQHLMTKREEQVARVGFDLNKLTEEELQEQYAQILAERDLADTDDSPDFEIADLEYESESEVESINLEQGHVLRASGRAQFFHESAYESPMSELMTSDAFVELIDQHDILTRHLHYEHSDHGILTRARYNALLQPEISSPQDEAKALLQLLLSKRHIAQTHSNLDDDDDIDPRLACVICQVKAREIITWPCKCFAICEGCRLSLASKGMEGCVCCRRDVEGVSKVFLP